MKLNLVTGLFALALVVSSAVTVILTPSPTHAAEPTFTRSLTIGDKGEDVRHLQQFLNTHGFTVALSGPGAPGAETTYFGPATRVAVIRYQNARSAEILTPVGLTIGTGYVGPSTIRQLNSELGNTPLLGGPLTQAQRAVILAKIQTILAQIKILQQKLDAIHNEDDDDDDDDDDDGGDKVVVDNPDSTSDTMAVKGKRLFLNKKPFEVRGVQIIGFLGPPNLMKNFEYLKAREMFGPDLLNAAKTWNVNTIRFQIGQSPMDPDNPDYSPDFVSEVFSGIRLARSLGFVVIASVQNHAAFIPPPNALPDHGTNRVLKKLAREFGDDQGIILELFNEPQYTSDASRRDQDYEILWNGGSYDGTTYVGYNELIQTIRDEGAQNLIIAGFLKQQSGGFPGPLTDPLNKVVYGFHPYFQAVGTNPLEWDDSFGTFAKTHPLIATEWHQMTDIKVMSTGWCATSLDAPRILLKYLSEKSIGLVGFSFDRPSTIVTDYNGTPRSYEGATCGEPGGNAGTLIKQLFTTGRLPADKPPELYVFAGQSNMVARGGDVDALEGISRGDSVQIVNMWNNIAEEFEIIQLGVNTAQWPQQNEHSPIHFGPEWSVANKLSSSPISTYFVKVAKGGTSLLRSSDWDPNADGNLFTFLTDTIRKARGNSGVSRVPVLKCFVWVQGEGDRGAVDQHELYSQNLKILADKVRLAGGNPTAQVAIVRLSPLANGEKKYETMSFRAMQKSFADTDPNVYLVGADNLTKLPNDNVHYDAESIMELGKRIYDACNE
jgi:hypothetical protein